MFTKKRILLFLFYTVLFCGVGVWILNNVEEKFSEVYERQTLEGVKSAVVSTSSGESLSESQNVLFVSDEHVSGNEKLKAFFEEKRNIPEFKKGIESASYDEIYRTNAFFYFNDEPVSIIFAPVSDHKNYEFLGTAVFFVNMAEQFAFIDLVRLLALGGLVLFALLLGITMFSRDVIVAYSVAALFIIVGTFVAWPLFESVRLSFTNEAGGKGFSLDTWKTIFESRGYINALRGSIQLGALTATFSTLIGFLFAFACSRTNIRFKGFFTAMGTIPVISPPFSLTLSIILLFGNNGLITKQILGLSNFNIYGLWGLVLVQTMGMFPIAFLTMSGVLDAIDSTFEDAAMNLSASKLKTFTSITLPLAMPGILSAWLLVFTNSLADFANPLILSGNFRVLSVESYLEVTGMNRLGRGAALSLLLLLPTLTAFFVQRFWVARRSFVTVTGKPSGHLSELVSPGVKRLLVGSLFLISAFLISLYGTIVAGCFVKNWGIDYSFSLENIYEALSRGRDALADTLTLASIATPIAGIIAMIAALLFVRKKFPCKRLLEGLIMTPFALPGTLMGISYILAFNEAPLLLVGTGAIIVINYVIRELPVGIEGGVASLRQIDSAIEEAAQDLGADSATVFRTIVLPLVRPAFISSLSYTFVRSMTAVSAVIFLISARWYHVTVLIYNFSENLRFGLASVLSTVLIIIVFGAFGIMRLIVRRNENLTKSVRVA